MTCSSHELKVIKRKLLTGKGDEKIASPYLCQEKSQSGTIRLSI
ncbi:hypothetical protein HMPREF1204_03079 [Bacteroides fragilis HMW 615]|nr:hypothetical protein HMPREF1204_03079 [Bacteroides fragilis HMW 615]